MGSWGIPTVIDMSTFLEVSGVRSNSPGFRVKVFPRLRVGVLTMPKKVMFLGAPPQALI